MVEMVTSEEILFLTDYYFSMYAKREQQSEKEIANNLNISESKLSGFINYVTVQKDFIPSFGNLYNIIMLTTIFKPKSKNLKRQNYIVKNNKDSEIVKIYQKNIGA